MAPATDRARGSTLLLFPAAVLVILVLGAIAADVSAVFLGERELANATAAAANDAATEALANAAFYRRGDVIVADAGAEQVATDDVRRALGSSDRYRNLRVTVGVANDRVTVAATAEVRHIFGLAVPGDSRWTTVDARTTARATERGPGP